eukprot:CAMPEP_0172519792 /NCGR_PEP_ID=MMETSP1066-20121228/291624_1 /TAXON_ID=671091 /ORGANISM="Coscinodiscus wailesii, Strain CCMP2513" /LENGTH=58 /DNA_ID=CAMNT_0013302439 /DNA_START=602 /DNA_END=778 /DNA_ORIENTATION=-
MTKVTARADNNGTLKKKSHAAAANTNGKYDKEDNNTLHAKSNADAAAKCVVEDDKEHM